MKAMKLRAAGRWALTSVVLAFVCTVVFDVIPLARAADPESRRARSVRKTVYEGAFLAPAKDFTRVADLFRAAFEEETLKRWFDHEHNVTIFAPTNEAVAALLDRLSEDDRTRLLNVNNGVLENVLRFHVAAGNWHRRWAGNQGAIGSIRTITSHGDSLRFSREAKGLKSQGLRVEGATLTRQTLYRNGALLEVDTVLIPPDAPEWLGCAWDTSKHNNNLDFTILTSLSATYNWFVVTHCQPHDSDPVASSGGFLVVAGRHASSAPAGMFKSGLTADNMQVTVDFADTEPSNLNFAFSADIKAVASGQDEQTYACNDVRFGQGSVEGTNNWWIGQPGAFPCSDPDTGASGVALQCTSSSGDDTTLLFFILFPSVPGNEFTFGVEPIIAPQQCK